MTGEDLEARLSLLLTQMEGDQGDRHEIGLRLKQTLDGMRAYGMPLPEDLIRLEEELNSEFGFEGDEAGANSRPAGFPSEDTPPEAMPSDEP